MSPTAQPWLDLAVPPRPLEEIDAEIKALEVEIQELLREVTE